MKSARSVLDGYLHQLEQYQSLLLHKENGSNTENICFLYRYLEQIRIMIEEASDVNKALHIYRLRLSEEKVLILLKKYGIEPEF